MRTMHAMRSGAILSVLLVLVVLAGGVAWGEAQGIMGRQTPAPAATPPQQASDPTLGPAPSSHGWRLVATDPDEGNTPDIAAVYYKVENGILYFKVEYYRDYSSINGIDTGIFIDVDSNQSTGYYVDSYPNANTGLGAEYVLVIGWESEDFTGAPASLWRNSSSSSWDLAHAAPADYYSVPDSGNTVVAGIYLYRLAGAGSTVKVAVADVPSNWDWCPDSGNVSITLIYVVGGNLDLGSPGAHSIQEQAALLLAAPIALLTIVAAIRRKPRPQ